MIKRISIVFLLFICLENKSQNWDTVIGGHFSKQLESVLYDSVYNELLVSSKFMNHVGNLSVRGICQWDGVNWDSLSGGINTHSKALNPSNPQGVVLTSMPYNNKLLVGGFFSSIGYVNTTGFAIWDGVKWDSLSKRAFRQGKSVVVSNFLKKGNLIYFTGRFDTIAGQPTNGIATWDGVNFNPILLPVDPNYQGITSIVEFQNEIYIAGGMFVGGKGDVLKFNGSNWVSTTGGGFLGPYAGARQLIVYNNELYAAGYFEMANGNPGNNVIKWDGNQWHDVGFGTEGSYIAINKLLVYHNKLWVFGGFYQVANSFTSNAAVFDGTSWCGLKDTLDNVIVSAAIYKDTIYVGGGFWKANSDSVPYFAKLSDANLFYQCVNVVGVNDIEGLEKINVSPNPTDGILNISDENNQLQNSTIQIQDNIGQVVYSSQFSSQIDLSDLSPGVYIIIIKSHYSSGVFKKIIKH